MTWFEKFFPPTTALGLVGMAVNHRQPARVDPFGCSWLKPGAFVFVGFDPIYLNILL